MALDWIRADVRAASAYAAPSFTGAVKLDAMESPYALDDGLKERWLKALAGCEVNRYPSGQTALKRHLAELMELPQNCDLLFGNGSDELLQIVALAARGERLLSPSPGFSMYPIIARNCGLAFAETALSPPDFALPRAAMLDAIARLRPALVWLAYPNNPTGKLWRRDTIDAVIEAAPGIVLMDEAYAAFASDSYWPSLGRCDNLLVLRTFSKIGLAGLRFGMLAGRADVIAELDKLRLPYNVGVLSEASIAFFLSHMESFERRADVIRAERERLRERLRGLPGVVAYPSEANFVLVGCARARLSADEIFRALRARGILVKSFPGDAVLGDCLRVTVGTPAENDAFVAALTALVGAPER